MPDPPVAACAGCGRLMHAGASCTVNTVQLDGDPFCRLPLGSESADWWVGREPDHKCHDCAVTGGQQHHLSCDMEQCPRCGDQFVACGCAGT